MSYDEELFVSGPHLGRRTQQVLIGVVTALLLAGLAYHFAPGVDSRPAITIRGAVLDDPAGVLASADDNLQTYVAAHGGVLAPGAGCYFERSPRAKWITGVVSTLLCGPALFFHGSQDRPYLRFHLAVTPVNGSAVRATVAAQPIDPDPGPAPAGSLLVTPGGTARPVARTDLPVPAPPPAPRDVVAVVSATRPADLPKLPPDAVMGTDDVTVAAQEAGPVTSYGSDGSERTAPRGQRLFAFLLAFSSGEIEPPSLPEVDLRVAVGSAAPRRLPVTNETNQFFVVAVPSPDTPLTLVLRDAGYTQRLDLRTGRPAPDNIAFLRGGGARDQDIEGVGSGPIVRAGRTTRAIVLTQQASEYFFLGHGTHPRSPRDVFLAVGLCHLVRVGRFGEPCYPIRPASLTLTPAGGRPVRPAFARVDFDPAVFEVPAAMRRGTLVLRGPVRDGSRPGGKYVVGRLVQRLVVPFTLHAPSD